jgi:hypothetical protein
LLLLPATLHFLRRSASCSQAAALRYRRGGRRGGGSGPHCRADPQALARDSHRVARRFGLCARGPDGLVRSQRRRLHLRPGPQPKACRRNRR